MVPTLPPHNPRVIGCPYYRAWIVCLRITLHALAYINLLRINPTATRLKISAARSGCFWRFAKAVCAALLSVPGVPGVRYPQYDEGARRILSQIKSLQNTGHCMSWCESIFFTAHLKG